MIKWLLLISWTIYLLNSWKDKRELFKRCVLALPFSLLVVVLFRLTVFRLSDSWPFDFGIIMFILLTAGTKNWKQHFVFSLVIGTILISLLATVIILIKSMLAGPVN